MDDRDSQISTISQTTQDSTSNTLQLVQLEDVEPLTIFLTSVSLSLVSVNRDQFHSDIHNNESQQTILDQEEKLQLSIEINSTSIHSHSIAFVKRSTFAVVSGMSPTQFSSILQVINLGYSGNFRFLFKGHETSPISINHLYVQNCFLPVFNVYKEQVEKQSNMEREQYQVLLKKLNELNLALIQCQQSVEVPEIQLQIEQVIKERCQLARKENRQITEDNFSDYTDKEEFIDALANCVNKWTRDISTVYKMKHEISNGTTMQEINYWMSYERSLNLIDQQLKLPEVQITIKILESKTRFAVTNAFKFDLNFKNIHQKCQACNSFTKDFPLNDLLSAHSLSDISSAQNAIFVHMKRITQIQEYKPERAFALLEALSRDINQQMIKILRQYKLMSMNFQDFIAIMDDAFNVFKKWNSDFTNFRQILQKFKLIQYNQYSKEGKILDILSYCTPRTSTSTLEMIQNIRVLHNRLREVIEKIIQKEKSSSKSDASFLNTKDIQDAYMVFYDLDVLDISKEGEVALFQAQKQYELKIDKVETTITAQLIDKLGQAVSANEMFRIFAKFNALFFRQHIRGAIQQYQSQLLTTVQKDISALQEKFLKSYQKTDNFLISKTRDIPQTAGSVIWAQQIQRKLDKYLERVENVLGEKWIDHVEGKKCKEIGDNFKKALNYIPIMENWNKSIIEFTRNINQNERIFDIIQKKKLEIVVNFDKRRIDLFKEIRFLQQLKTRINAYVNIMSSDSKKYYPFAVSLQESIHQYNQISSKIDDKMKSLVASHRWEIHQELNKGMNISWSYMDQLGSFTKKLAEKVLSLEEAVNGLTESYDQINVTLAQLSTCHLDQMREKLETIQKIIDDFSLKNYSNLHIWVKELDVKLEQILAERLTQLVKFWMEEFEGYRNEHVEKVYIKEIPTHELKIKDQTIFIEPSLEFARFHWFKEFHKILGKVATIPRLQADRYEQLLHTQALNEETDYSSILKKLEAKVLQSAYQRIDYILNDAEKYVSTWLSYSALWKVDSRKIYETLEDNIDRWQSILNEIKMGRVTFDNSETEIHFGAIIPFQEIIKISFFNLQVKINNKYDQWHREILNHFGETFQDKLKVLYKTLMSSRGRLEKINFQGAQVDLMIFITDLKDLKEKQQIWGIEMESFRSGQKLLERQRYVYPSEWLWLDQVEQEWSNFKQLFSRRNAQFDKETPQLQNKIVMDEQLLNEKIKQIDEMWTSQRPYSGELMPNKALDVLNIIEGQLLRVKDEYIKCCKCKELLNLEPGNPQKLEDLSEDLVQLRDVWSEMQKLWRHVEELRDMLVYVVQNKKVKESTEIAQQELSNLPNNMKTYDAYEKMKDRIKYRFFEKSH